MQGKAAFSVYTQTCLLGQNVQIQVRGVLSDAAHIEEVLKAPVRVLGNLSVVSVLSVGFYLNKIPGKLIPFFFITVEIDVRGNYRRKSKQKTG